MIKRLAGKTAEGECMRKELLLLNMDLASFEGGGDVVTSGTGGVAPTQAVETPGASTSTKDSKPVVLYGKQEGLEGEVQASNTNARPNTNGEPPAVDPSSEFENLIKGQYKDQFDARIQSIIDRRFKGAKETETKLTELNPIVELLMEKYEASDVNGLREKMENEIIEELAYRKGMDTETYREFREAKQLADQMKQHQQSVDVQSQIDQKVAGWFEQADKMKSDYPDFNFREYANENPEFINLLNANVPVKQAYELLNLDNIKANTAKQAQDNTVKSIQAKGNRPREAAASNGNSPVVKSNVNNLTKEDRAEIAKRVARGEKISF